MEQSAVVNRLRAIATDLDLEADELYRKASGRSIYRSCYREEATAKRGDVAFMRNVADALERIDDPTDELAKVRG